MFLGLTVGKNYGWGICSDYLIKELSRLVPVHVLNARDNSHKNPDLPGKLFQALTSVHFFPLFPEARGRQNYGYTFFENELSGHSIENAKRYDLILAGSSWCRERLTAKGIMNCEILLQGIDTQKFYPIQKAKSAENFVIFSGGKFELRKGQDLVLRAVKILQDKYKDIVLVNCWYNLWPQSIAWMTHSPYIKLPRSANGNWTQFMNSVYVANGLDPDRIKTLELVPHYLLRGIYHHTDIGVFPNRCEGGPNLVLMEYMACAKPVIASHATGHKDVVTGENSLLLTALRSLEVFDGTRNLIGRWQEPALEELVEKIEYAYHHREEIRAVGQRAGEDLQRFTWRQTAKNLLKIIGISS
ncbi:MAG: glycosyltransferase family 4 protein [Desulfobacterales bacterium]|nr:MAG: glycosyltransferase family 4 protein [Desulfobacterales bacterium]